MMKQLFRLIVLSCLTGFSLPKVLAFTPDSITIQCYQNDLRYTPLAVHFINTNQIDALDSLYKNLPHQCGTKGWNQLMNLFIVCVKYPERIHQLNDAEMHFIIDYIYRIKHKQIYFKAKDTVYYDYHFMPAFHRLHETVQKYLMSYYSGLNAGTLNHKLVGTILQYDNAFFDYFNNPSNQFAGAQISYQSYMKCKQEIQHTGHIYLHLNTSYTRNNQLGNSIHFEWLGVEVITEKYSAGVAAGVSTNTTAPNYTITYNKQELAPQKTQFLSLNIWFNYILLRNTPIKPYLGVGVTYMDSQHIFTVMGERKTLSVYGGQVYPEFGMLIGRTPYYGLKIHCSYRFNFLDVDYWGEAFTDGDMSSNIYQNDLRLGLAVYINIFTETKHKGQLMGLY